MTWLVLSLVVTAAVAEPAEPLPELRALERALEGGPVEPGASMRTVLAALPGLWKAQRFREAAALLAAAPSDPPLELDAEWLRAESLSYAGDFQGAVSILERLGASSAEDPVVGLARARLPEALMAAGFPRRAAALCQARLGPAGGTGLRASSAAWEECGRALAASGDRTHAIAAFREAWLRDPSDPAAESAAQDLAALGAARDGAVNGKLLDRVRQLLSAGRPTAAHEEAKLVSGAGATGREELYSGQADRVLGRMDEALEHWSRAMGDRSPQVAALASIAYAKALDARGEWGGAVALLTAVSKRQPKSVEALEAAYLAAWLELQHGALEEALTRFRRLVQIGRRHADEARWWIGWALFGAGRPSEAAKAWIPLALSPSSDLAPQARYWSARLLAGLGRRAEAEALLAPLRDGPPSYYALLANGGRVLTTKVAPSCPSASKDLPVLPRLRRAEWLWALGERQLSTLELDRAAAEASAGESAADVAEAEAALGEAGRAFALVSSGKTRCGPASPDMVAAELFPRPHREAVERAAAAAGVDPLLLWSVMRQESRFREGARSAAQASGLMQLIGPTRSRIARITGAPATDDADGEIAAAAWYLRALLDRFGNEALAIAAYNGGPDAVERWRRAFGDRPLDELVERIPFRETRRYVKRVLENHASYLALFGSGAPIIEASWIAGRAPTSGVDF
ncbi:MAG: lytic transglycosylase domain-containing protein [Deltaproteobacteria bacterium]